MGSANGYLLNLRHRTGNAAGVVQQGLALQDPCTVLVFWWPAPNREETGAELAVSQGCAENT